MRMYAEEECEGVDLGFLETGTRCGVSNCLDLLSEGGDTLSLEDGCLVCRGSASFYGDNRAKDGVAKNCGEVLVLCCGSSPEVECLFCNVGREDQCVGVEEFAEVTGRKGEKEVGVLRWKSHLCHFRHSNCFLASFAKDPLMLKYTSVIFSQFDFQNLFADLLLGLIRKVLQIRGTTLQLFFLTPKLTVSSLTQTIRFLRNPQLLTHENNSHHPVNLTHTENRKHNPNHTDNKNRKHNPNHEDNENDTDCDGTQNRASERTISGTDHWEEANKWGMSELEKGGPFLDSRKIPTRKKSDSSQNRKCSLDDLVTSAGDEGVPNLSGKKTCKKNMEEEQKKKENVIKEENVKKKAENGPPLWRARAEIPVRLMERKSEAENLPGDIPIRILTDESEEKKNRKNVRIHIPETYSTEIAFLKEPCGDYVAAAVQTVININQCEAAGSVLVCLAADAEVLLAISLLRQYTSDHPDIPPIIPLPLGKKWYGSDRGRKVYVCVSERGSPQVNFVVICMYTQITLFDAPNFLSIRATVPLSQTRLAVLSSLPSNHRRGKCYCLCTAEWSESLIESIPGEIYRRDLSDFVLKAKLLGVDSLSQFQYVNPPFVQSLTSALQTLHSLDLINNSGILLQPNFLLPLPPSLLALILTALHLGCEEEAVRCAAILKVGNVFRRPRTARAAERAAVFRDSVGVEEGDVFSLVNLLALYERSAVDDAARKTGPNYTRKMGPNYTRKMRPNSARSLEELGEIVKLDKLQKASAVHKYIVEYLKKNDMLKNGYLRSNVEQLPRAIFKAFNMNLARRNHAGFYDAVASPRLKDMRPASDSFLALTTKPWLVYTYAILDNNIYMHNVTPLKSEWITQESTLHCRTPDVLVDD